MLNRRARTMGLGSADLVDLASARRQALEYRRLLQQGLDPLEQRHAAEIAKQEGLKIERARLQGVRTFDQCVDEYLDLHSENWKNLKHRQQWKNSLKDYASIKCGPLSVESVTKEHIIDALKPIWTSKAETASRTLQRIVRVLVWANAKGYRGVVDGRLGETVAAALGPQNQVRGHMASCHYSEVSGILREIESSTARSTVKAAFEFTVLTAARSGETRGARWSEFDLDQKVWSIPADRMKAGRPHEVPLCDRAMALLKQAASLGAKPDGLVFPGRNGKVLSDMVFTQLLRRLKIACTLHGFRSTFRVWAAEKTDHPPEVCEAALAHATGNQVERAYNRTSLLEKRVPLMTEWAAFIQKGTPKTSSL